VLIVNAEVDSRPGVAVRVRNRQVVETGEGLRPIAGEQVLNANGGAVIPGLHDHHVHLRSAVAAASSVDLGPSSTVAAGGLEAALSTAADALPDGAWVRGVGAHGAQIEAMDRFALDAIVAGHPIRIQHRTGAMWLLNSAAVRQLRVEDWQCEGVERFADGSVTGRLWRADQVLQDALRSGQHDQSEGLATFSSRALQFGITGFTDATPDRTAADIDDLISHVEAGRIRQRLTLMAPPEHRVRADCAVDIGAFKIVLDDDALPEQVALAAVVSGAHSQGSAVAVHCVSAEQLVVAVAAIRSAGPGNGDRIEHAGIVPPGYSHVLAELGVAVVTQPGFIAVRGDDYLHEVPGPERDWLYPCGSLLAAGVPVAAGSDAPFGPLDPWLAMTAAVTRRAASGMTVAACEQVDPATALGLYLGSAEAPGRIRRVAMGQPGELCVLRSPLAAVLEDLGAHQLAAVIVDDEVFEWNR
jgi:predicted amidohydrolase YtcJ